MPTISMSDGFRNNFQSNFYANTAVTNASYTLGDSTLFPIGMGIASGRVFYAQLYILSGTRPAISSLTTTTPPAGTSILATFNTGGTTHTTNSTSNGVLTVTSSYITVSASGTATWFWVAYRGVITTANSDFSSFANTNVYHSIIGDIGGPGSGADLEISNVNLTAGQQIRIANLRFSFPTVFNY